MVRRRVSAVLATTVLAGSVLGAPAAARPSAAPRHVETTTVLTVSAPGCAGCRLTASSARASDTALGTWSRSVTVRNGVATFRVPTGRTRGLTLDLGAPWEGLLGYHTQVAMRYGTAEVGDRIGFDRARRERRATACWAGTTATRATLSLGIQRVRVQGLVGTVDGTIAWVKKTPEWLEPMRPSPKGVLGSVDGGLCVG